MMIVQAGQRLMKQCRSLEPVEPRHLDVEQGDVRARGERRGHHLIAARALRDDVDVVLEREQRGERAADHPLVLGDQHADHAAAAGHVRLEAEPAPRAGAGLEASAGGAHSLPKPVQPAASGTRDAADAVVDDRHCETAVARLERDLAVVRAAVAQHVGHPLAHRPREQAVHRRRRGDAVARHRELDSRGVEDVARALELVGERTLPVSGDHARGPRRATRARPNSTSPIASAAASGSVCIRRRATCALSAITDRLWPRMS